MNKYESMIIVNPDITEEDVKKENQKLAELIAKSNGKMIKTDFVGKRKLAYQINKKDEGYYLVNYFEMSSEAVNTLTKHYVLADNIMRFNLLRIEEDAIPTFREKPEEETKEAEVRPEEIEPEKQEKPEEANTATEEKEE